MTTTQAGAPAGTLPEVPAEAGWTLVRDRFDPVRERVTETLLAVADGRVGVTGAPLAAHPSARPTALVAGVYTADGPGSHLLPGPVALRLPYDLPDRPSVRRVLDLRAGVLHEQETTTAGPVSAVRFACLARPGTVVLRAACPDGTATPVLTAPADVADVEHGTQDGATWLRVRGGTGGVVAAVRAQSSATPDGVLVDAVASYVGDPDDLPSPDLAVAEVDAAQAVGVDDLLAEQRRTWAARWDDADVAVEGDPELQLATRLALFHLVGSVADRDEAAVGARGITGHGYSGHVFWDADTFVLPFFAATHPASARAMLEYRVRRLPAALRTARELGRDGARFPWESAHSGRDVTPTSAYDRTGRLVEIRTGQQEEHVVAQVAWAASHYLDWTGDTAFAHGPGLRLLVETARWWASRAERDGDGTAHLRHVIGPDEYHEGVDDDAFTNVMARWNLRRAADAVDDPRSPRAGVLPDEVARWREVADALVDGYDPATGRHEQFAGFSQLEPLVIAEVAPRRPIAADVLMGWERLQGAQVLKQADVLMLHHLLPDEVPPGSFAADLAYYEPRTAHGSSLSPGVHAALLARAGELDAALDALEITRSIDLADLTGSTAAGFHLATAGGLWQALVLGFAGTRPCGDRLSVDPHVPASWGALDVRLRFRGARVRLRCTADDVDVRADRPVPLLLRGAPALATADGLRPDPEEPA